jgi:uncharacterized OB-fold protein
MDERIAQNPPPEFFELAVDTWTKPYWDAAREHRLTACRCTACGRFRMPPTPFCPYCRSQAVDWPTLSGRGRIFSFTIVERAPIPGALLPYAPAIIELPDAQGVRLVSNIVDCAVGDIAADAEVEVAWQDREDGVSIARFRLVR